MKLGITALHTAVPPLANGSSQLGAQIRGLPQLPAAIGSYFRERFK